MARTSNAFDQFSNEFFSHIRRDSGRKRFAIISVWIRFAKRSSSFVGVYGRGSPKILSRISHVFCKSVDAFFRAYLELISQSQHKSAIYDNPGSLEEQTTKHLDLEEYIAQNRDMHEEIFVHICRDPRVAILFSSLNIQTVSQAFVPMPKMSSLVSY